ncbi:MAG: peptidoglycan-associated lipoprotein [Gammaproteobacteria bacterium]|jgi:peptidoglycan-associated lipoprotein|nr:peptidoglycan-associated lipoprotein [Gammaproteobacteria bacterium]
MLKQLVRYSLILGAVFLLAACSSFGSHGGSGSDTYESDAQTYGAGDQAGFNGQNTSPAELMKKTVFHFGFDKDTVNDEDVAAIEAHGVYLAKHPDAKVTLEGHTDQRGSREYNVGLGERRAATVQQLLLVNGANALQIKMVSYGQEKPVALGYSEEDYALNRRVEIIYNNK